MLWSYHVVTVTVEVPTGALVLVLGVAARPVRLFRGLSTRTRLSTLVMPNLGGHNFFQE